jgi:hypothetical protein
MKITLIENKPVGMAISNFSGGDIVQCVKVPPGANADRDKICMVIEDYKHPLVNMKPSDGFTLWGNEHSGYLFKKIGYLQIDLTE